MPAALEADVTSGLIGMSFLPNGLGYESGEAYELGGALGFPADYITETIFFFGGGRRQSFRSSGFEARTVEGVILRIPFTLVHDHRGLDQAADGGGQEGTEKRNVGEGRRGDGIRPVLGMQVLEVVGIFEGPDGVK